MSRSPRGAILLEAVIALAIFLAVAAFVLAASRRSLGVARAAALEARSTDLARSALAAIDAGLVPTAALDGGDGLLEAIGWLDPEDAAADAAGFDAGRGRWSVEVTMDPSGFAGLTMAEVVAWWSPPGMDTAPDDPEAEARVSLRGLVRLADAEPGLGASAAAGAFGARP